MTIDAIGIDFSERDTAGGIDDDATGIRHAPEAVPHSVAAGAALAAPARV